MDNNFNYDEVEFQGSKFESKYLNGGNHKVKVVEVISGKSSAKQSPYVKITVADETGKTAEQTMYLTGGAFKITMQRIYTLIGATMGLNPNVQEEYQTIKIKFGKPANEDEIANKLSTLVTGKTFGIHLDEEWVNPSDTTKNSFRKAIFGTGKYAVPASKMSELKTEVTVRGEKAPSTTTSTPVDDWA